MKQTKIDSVLEVLTNIAIGFTISLIVTLAWFPMIGKELTLYEDLMTVGVFTVISFLRSYFIRRLFDGKSVYQYIKSKIFKPRRMKCKKPNCAVCEYYE